MTTNPLAHHATTPTFTTTFTGPLVFQYENSNGHRYHVAGQGFTAKDLRAATRHTVNASFSSVGIDPFVPAGGHLYALALVECEAIEETVIRASWGDKQLMLSPTNLHSEAFAIIYPLLHGLVRSGGTPFGPTLRATDTKGSKLRGAIFNIAFLLPPGVDDLLAPLSSLGARSPREILTWISLLGLRLKGRSKPKNFSIWQRKIGGLSLLLETGFGCEPESLTLLAKESESVVIDLAGRSFTEIHPLLLSFIATAKATKPERTLEIFIKTFVENLVHQPIIP